jgi:chemotaxis signal transduction protein
VSVAPEDRILIARAGAEHFGFQLASVLEALDAAEVSPLPLVPPGVLGQCAYRGALLPVLDPAPLLGAPLAAAPGGTAGAERSVDAGTVLVMVADEPFAIAMDDVSDMVSIEPRARRSLPTGADRGGLLAGLLAHEGALVGLVSPDLLRAAAASVLSPHSP